MTNIAGGGGGDICRIGVEVFLDDSCSSATTTLVENNNVFLNDGDTCTLGISTGVNVTHGFESVQMLVSCIVGGVDIRADNWFLRPGTQTVPVELLNFEIE